jgi:hypothetical protein
MSCHVMSCHVNICLTITWYYTVHKPFDEVLTHQHTYAFSNSYTSPFTSPFTPSPSSFSRPPLITHLSPLTHHPLLIRSIESDMNVFQGLVSNPIFVGILLFTVVAQYGLVEFGGAFVRTVRTRIHIHTHTYIRAYVHTYMRVQFTSYTFLFLFPFMFFCLSCHSTLVLI